MNTIQPWIRTHLIYLAENYGGNLLGMPREPKNKKVQAIEFLTPHEVGKEGWVWVVVSDRHHKIPARLSKEAVREFEKHPTYQGKSLSSYKTAVLSLTQFRPAFTRIPGPNGMKPDSQLVLDVDRFELKGCFGEAVYGSPRAVEHDESVREWSEGLKSDGGGGNVLKLRKEERAKAAQAHVNEAGPSHAQESPRKRVIPSLLIQKLEVPAPSAKNRNPPTRVSKHSGKALARRAWNRIWRADGQYSEIYSGSFARVTPAAQRKHTAEPEGTRAKSDGRRSGSAQTPVKKKLSNALDMSTPPPSPKRVERDGLVAEDEARPTTPSQWASSVHSQPSSPVPMDIDDAEDKADARSDDGSVEEDFNMASSPPGAPASVSSQEDDFDIRSTPHQSPEPAARPPVEEESEVVKVDRPEQHDAERELEKDEQAEADAEASTSFRLPESSPEHQARICSQPLDSPLHEPESPSQPRSAMRSSSLPAANQAFVASQNQGVEESPQAPPNWRRFLRPFKVPFEQGRVLVPNSDSSQSQSHSQSHSHSQSLTQSQSQTQLLTQAPVFSSQIPQSQDREDGPPLTGPQQSLSYTSQSQSQSQASKESQNELLPAKEAEHQADADVSNDVSLEDVRPEEQPKTELPAQESETTPEEPMDVDVDEDMGGVKASGAHPNSSGPQGPARAVDERHISPEILDALQSQRSSPPGGDNADEDEEENVFDSAEVRHMGSSPPAQLLDKDGYADSDDEGARDESDELPNSPADESDEADGDEAEDDEMDGEEADGEKVDDQEVNEEVMDGEKVVDDDGGEDEEVLEALAIGHDESDEEDELDQEAVSREEEEGSMKPEEEEEGERLMVKEEEEESTQSQLADLERGNIDRKDRVETKVSETGELSSDDAQTRRKLRRSNGATTRSAGDAVPGSSVSPQKPTINSRPLILTHNVMVWQKPSFQRNLEQAGAQKRLASSSPDDGGKVVKKQRRLSPRPAMSPSRQIPKPVASSSKTQHRAFSHDKDTVQPASSKVRHADINVADPSALVGKVKGPRSPVNASGWNTVDSASQVKHMDFSPVISTPASKKGKERAYPQVSADTTSAGIYRSKSAASRSSSFKPTANAQMGQTDGLNTSTLSQLKTTHTPRGKFGGYKLDLSITPDADGPPLVTWKALTDILLRTGRARHKENKQKEHAADS